MTRLKPDRLRFGDLVGALLPNDPGCAGYLVSEMEVWWLVVMRSDVPGYRYVMLTDIEQPPGTLNHVWVCDADDDVLCHSFHTAQTYARRLREHPLHGRPSLDREFAVLNLADHMRGRMPTRGSSLDGVLCRAGSRIALSWPYAV